jgi:hypothetical protein
MPARPRKRLRPGCMSGGTHAHTGTTHPRKLCFHLGLLAQLFGFVRQRQASPGSCRQCRAKVWREFVPPEAGPRVSSVAVRHGACLTTTATNGRVRPIFKRLDGTGDDQHARVTASDVDSRSEQQRLLGKLASSRACS